MSCNREKPFFVIRRNRIFSVYVENVTFLPLSLLNHYTRRIGFDEFIKSRLVLAVYYHGENK